MIIIDKTKPSSPILVYSPPPSFNTQYEREKYRAEEKRRWIEGHNGVPGTLYHYIQEQKIKNRLTGAIIRPTCRDADLLIHEEIKRDRGLNRMLGVLKGRGLGLSSIGGSLTNYFQIVYPGSTSLITSKEQSNISTLFSDKIMTVFNSYDSDIKPAIINKNESKHSAYLKCEIPFKNEEGQVEYGQSQVFCKETSEKKESPNGFSGQGAIFGFYDELPLHKRKKELLMSSLECYRDPLTKEFTGFLLWGGTCEQDLTAEQLVQFQKMVKDSELWKTDILFVPFWMGMHMTNGHSDEKKGMGWWEKEMETLTKSGDEQAIRAFKKNNPRSLDDIFDLARSGRWEEDVSEKIKLQYANVVKENIVITTCNLIEIGGNVETSVTNKGKVTILEHPKQGVQYYLGVDGIATGKKAGEDEGSNVAGVIGKLFDPQGLCYAPICIYDERPETIEQAYIILSNQVRYYNKFGGFKGIMAEANAGTADHFSTFLDKIGLGKFIMNRQDLSGKGHTNTAKLFQYKTVDVGDWQVKEANAFLRKRIDVIKMPKLLADMMKSLLENADVLDAWLMVLVAMNSCYDKPIKSVRPIVQKQIRIMSRGANGETIQTWKTVNM